MDEFNKLIIDGLGLFAVGAGSMTDAVAKMIAHQLPPHRAERFVYRCDLGEDLRAVAILFNHARQAANLSLDAFEAREVGGLDLWIDPMSLAGLLLSGCITAIARW